MWNYRIQEVNTIDDWNAFVQTPGIKVIEIYNDFTERFEPFNYMLQDSPIILQPDETKSVLLFSACADKFSDLEKYRGKSAPTFLIYKDNILLKELAGLAISNLENLVSIILSESESFTSSSIDQAQSLDSSKITFVSSETKLLRSDRFDSGSYDRTVYKVKENESLYEKVLQEGERLDAENWITPTPLKFIPCIMIVKPHIVREDKEKEIFEMVVKSEMKIIYREERTLSQKEVEKIYQEKYDEETMREFYRVMIVGKSVIYVIEYGRTGIQGPNALKKLIGPDDPKEARATMPNSIRALYGIDLMRNAVDISETIQSAKYAFNILFPATDLPLVSGGIKQVNFKKKERTLAILRPSIVRIHQREIIERIKANHFEIMYIKECIMDKRQFQMMYSRHVNKYFYELLLKEMTKSECIILCLAKENAVEDFRKLIGPAKEEDFVNAPGTIRGDIRIPESFLNCIHGSIDEKNATREINLFFPMERTVAIIKPEVDAKDEYEIICMIKKKYFAIIVQERMTLSRNTVKRLYAAKESAYWFNDLLDYMTSGPSTVMILARENAVEAWREMVGYRYNEFEMNKEISIRQLFGTDEMKNAVHASTNSARANDEIKIIFGDNLSIRNVKALDFDSLFVTNENEYQLLQLAEELSRTSKRELIQYTIVIKSVTGLGNEKDDDIYLTLEGNLGLSRKIPLKISLDNEIPFKKDQTDTFLGVADDVGNIERIIFSNDIGEFPKDWFIDYVSVYQKDKDVHYKFYVTSFIEPSSYTSSHSDVENVIKIKQEDFNCSVIIETGNQKYAGTYGKICLSVCNNKNEIWNVPLRKTESHAVPFRKGNRDIFKVNMPTKFTPIEYINISLKPYRHSPSWYINFILFQFQESFNYISFPIKRWLSDTYKDCLTEIKVKENSIVEYDLKKIEEIQKNKVVYEIIIQTGTQYFAGTNSYVLVDIKGSNQNAYLKKYLEIAENTDNPFEPSGIDYFLFYSDDIGKIRFVTLAHSGQTSEEAWFVEKIIIRYNERDSLKFNVSRWLDKQRESNSITFKLTRDGHFIEDKTKADIDYFEDLTLFSNSPVKVADNLLSYEIQIITHQLRKPVGASCEFYIEIIGDGRSTGPLQLISVQGQESISDYNWAPFTVIGKQLKKIEFIRLSLVSQNGKCGWYVKSIVLFINEIKEAYSCIVNCWLDEEETGFMEITVPVYNIRLTQRLDEQT